ncbi:uncharacterized protein ACO6RY_14366 [Pungitius sinensis]
MEEDKDQSSSPATPKQNQATVTDGDPNVTSTLEIADTIAAGVMAVSQRPATFVRETRQSFHFGSYGREDRVEEVKISGLSPTEALDGSVPIHLTPTLPSPMSRPEKKTYCCAECGKEYASRSGLKGHMKHHATRSSAGFWNQYQAFLNTSNEPTDEPTLGVQGDNGSTKSPIQSQIDSRTPEEAEQGSSEGS